MVPPNKEIPTGGRNLVIGVALVAAGILGFYGFLAYRARLWTPLWVISPTEKVYVSLPPQASASDSSLEQGRRLYRQLACGVCHGPQGEGGVQNPNSSTAGMVPGLWDLAGGYTPESLKDKIKKGTPAAKMEEDKPDPPLDMPAWEKTMTDEELEDLVRYLFSLKTPPENQAKGGI